MSVRELVEHGVRHSQFRSFEGVAVQDEVHIEVDKIQSMSQ